LRKSLVLAAVFLIIIAFLFSGSFAALISLVTFYFLVTGSIYISEYNRGQKTDLLSVFQISFIFYLFLSVLSYLAYVEINDYFIFSDQEEFFDYGEELGKSSSIYEIFSLCFIERIHFINEGVIFYFGLMAYLANLADGNNLFYQIVNVSYFGILINIYIFKTLLFYTDKNKAFKYSIYYALFSHIPIFSIWLLRDIHIAFFFSIAIFLVHCSFRVKNLVYFLFLSIIVFEFRLVTGIAFLFLPLLYILKGIKNSDSKYIYSTLFFFFVLALLFEFKSQLIFFYNSLLEGFEHYSEYSIEVATDQGGLGGLLLGLPVVLKQSSILIYSQISPFPIWDQLLKSNTFIQYIFSVIFMISPLFWGFVFYFVFARLYSDRSKVNLLQFVLLLFFIVFLIGNSSNLNLRRIISVYPILYGLFVLYITSSSKTLIKSYVQRYFVGYSLLVVVYLILKYLVF
jgi:hypothetical protein